MTLTFGLIGAALVLVAAFLAFQFAKAPRVEAAPDVVRVTRKDRARQMTDADQD